MKAYSPNLKPEIVYFKNVFCKFYIGYNVASFK